MEAAIPKVNPNINNYLVPFEKMSLNKAKRKKELIEITMQNQQILKRLTEKNSTYNVNKWERDR
jgi:hypothetical protein